MFDPNINIFPTNIVELYPSTITNYNTSKYFPNYSKIIIMWKFKKYNFKFCFDFDYKSNSGRKIAFQWFIKVIRKLNILLQQQQIN